MGQVGWWVYILVAVGLLVIALVLNIIIKRYNEKRLELRLQEYFRKTSGAAQSPIFHNENKKTAPEAASYKARKTPISLVFSRAENMKHKSNVHKTKALKEYKHLDTIYNNIQYDPNKTTKNLSATVYDKTDFNYSKLSAEDKINIDIIVTSKSSKVGKEPNIKTDSVSKKVTDVNFFDSFKSASMSKDKCKSSAKTSVDADGLKSCCNSRNFLTLNDLTTSSKHCVSKMIRDKLTHDANSMRKTDICTERRTLTIGNLKNKLFDEAADEEISPTKSKINQSNEDIIKIPSSSATVRKNVISSPMLSARNESIAKLQIHTGTRRTRSHPSTIPSKKDDDLKDVNTAGSINKNILSNPILNSFKVEVCREVLEDVLVTLDDKCKKKNLSADPAIATSSTKGNRCDSVVITICNEVVEEVLLNVGKCISQP